LAPEEDRVGKIAAHLADAHNTVGQIELEKSGILFRE